jgi:V-type H+-transporting ATPase subunit C
MSETITARRPSGLPVVQSSLSSAYAHKTSTAAMAQYLLLAFKQQPGADLRQTIQSLVGSFGPLQEFPVSNSLAQFQSTDQLMSVADDLGRLDATTWGLLTRTARSINDLVRKIKQDNEKGWTDLCPQGSFRHGDVPEPVVVIAEGQNETEFFLDEYIVRWEWDEALQRSNVPIVDIVRYFTAQAQQQEDDLRTASTGFTDAGNRVVNLRRRNEGNLLVRNLDEIGSSMREIRTLREFQAGLASQTLIYVETRNIQTILVVVKRSGAEEFRKTYALDTEYIVPESIQELTRDNDYICFSVALLATNLDDYRTLTKDRGWHVRDFTYNSRMREQLAEEAQRTVTEYINESAKFSEHLQSTFSHLAVVWMHVRATRIFVEATLLYGIPPSFKTFLLTSQVKNLPKIHKELEKQFADEIPGVGGDDDEGTAEDSEYHPYVSYHVNLVGLVPATPRKR